MTTPAPARCPRCGRELRGGALDGLCPTCLMRQALVGDTQTQASGSLGSRSCDSSDSSVLFTASLSASAWTLVTLLADDEEYVTYLAHERDPAQERNADGLAGTASRLAQLVVRKQHVPDAEAAAARLQLQRRGDALRRLSHPTLSSVLDGGLTDDGHPFLVTTFVMATPLADLDPEGAAPDQTRKLLDDARAGLRALHDAGLAHGRVRTSTVLARPAKGGATAVVTGYAPLLDFPILASAVEDDLAQFHRLTSTLRA
jgi:hypothetical protein